ncbi:MAG TPA: hypothetical protein VGQ83_00125 [Polyangia bacterium]
MLESLRALEEFARGDRPDGGRDEVARLRIASGAMSTRGLPLEVAAEPDERGLRLRLRTDGAEVRLRLEQKGTFIFTFGDATLEVDDRHQGAAFARAVASWLGVPLGDPGAALVAPEPVVGAYARLGVRRDASGQDWELLKLFLGDEPRAAEVFFRLRADHAAAVLGEKASFYRVPLAELLSAALGDGRAVVPHQRLMLDHGNLEVAVPPTWSAKREESCITLQDPADTRRLEISYLRLPSLAPDAPSLADRLRHVLLSAGEQEAAAHIDRQQRANLELVWADYPYEAHDDERDIVRPARGRWLLASNGVLQALLTYYYWTDDAPGAVADWEQVAAMLRLQDDPGAEVMKAWALAPVNGPAATD